MAKKPRVRRLVYEDSVLELLRRRRDLLKIDLKAEIKNHSWLHAAQADAQLDLVEDLLWQIGVWDPLEGPNE